MMFQTFIYWNQNQQQKYMKIWRKTLEMCYEEQHSCPALLRWRVFETRMHHFRVAPRNVQMTANWFKSVPFLQI